MILVTGAAGYIGSHIILELIKAGHGVIGLDNLCNSNVESLRRVENLSGRRIRFIEADLRDRSSINVLFANHAVAAVIHCAGLKSVGESSVDPLNYYETNVLGTAHLLAAMKFHQVKRLIFSSSATVYGTPLKLPLSESHITNPSSPYGRTKLVVEQMLADIAQSDPVWRVGILRYFNPVGAHPSGLIGDSPKGPPNNLMPSISQVATGHRTHLTVFGQNYATPDGSGVRDYIHVVDVAEAHVCALNHLESEASFTFNLGTGRGFSVIEILRAFEAASGQTIPYVIGPARVGDVASCYADTSAAEYALNWRAKRSLSEMCADHWRWLRLNPHGFETIPSGS